MKKGIHPESFEVEAVCGCGNKMQVKASVKNIRTEICSKCHPFFTGTEKLVDATGRVDRFQKRFNWDEKKAGLKI